jgi:phage terminase large subunit
MALVSLPNNWQPRKYQLSAWSALENGIKRALLVWHRRAGKDDVCLHFAATQVVQRVGNYWHMLPEYEQARKSVWNAINPHTGMRRIDEAFPKEIRKRTLDQSMMIEFVNGATWQLVGSDNFNSLVGSPPIGVTASEWALANPSAWAYLSPILRENGGWAVFITTPRGRNHVYKMAQGFKDNPSWHVEIKNIEDTKALTKVQIQEALDEYISTYGETQGRSLFDQEYMCSFDAAVLGAFYAKEMSDAERGERIREVPYDPNLPVYTAWDIGYSDDTSIWFWQMAGGEIHVIDFYASNGHGVEHYVEVLNKKGYNYAKLGNKPFLWLPHDARAKTFASGGKSTQEQFMAHGYSSRIVPELSLQDGINALRMMLPKMYFDRQKTFDGVESLKLYRREYDDDKKVFRDKPLHDWTSHAADAARYMAIAYREASPEARRPEPKFAFRGTDNGITSLTMNEMWALTPKRDTRI